MLLIYNVAIRVTSKSSQRQHVLTVIDQLSPSTDCVFLGNSLVEAGCDITTFKNAWPKEESARTLMPANLALGATTPVEHCLIFKGALHKPLPLKFLIYGFFDDQLNVRPQGNWSDLVGNRALSYYFPGEAASLYAPGSPLKKWKLTITGHIPMLAERSSLWGKVELLRRYCEEIGMPRQRVNRFGRVDDFAALESKDAASFIERCDSVVNENRGFSRAVRQIIELAQARGARVILVEMPMPSRHRKTFYSTAAWLRLRSHLQELASEDKAIYLPASDWVTDDLKFEDATHLNEEGARSFSAQLASAVFRLCSETNQLAAYKRPL
jgi:hypothetical protein